MDADLRRDDELLLGELRDALATLDPVPEGLRAAAKECFVWRRIDEELAELAADSAAQPLGAARSTSAEGPTESRLLTFEASGLNIEVEVTAVGERRRLVGQLVPPRSARIEVRWPGGHTTGEADTIGLFSIDSVPAGPVSIACDPPPGERAPQTVTSWVTI